jgi:hypothetical protein
MAARWAVREVERTSPAPRVEDAFLRALAIGKEFEDEARRHWPTKLGRRPPLALDLAIESVYDWKLFSDTDLWLLVDGLLARGRITIPGVDGKVNERYITLRRQRAGIHRRRPATAFLM